ANALAFVLLLMRWTHRAQIIPMRNTLIGMLIIIAPHQLDEALFDVVTRFELRDEAALQRHLGQITTLLASRRRQLVDVRADSARIDLARLRDGGLILVPQRVQPGATFFALLL